MRTGSQIYAPVVLRSGLTILFLWFGFSQVLSPDMWTSWVPEWASSILGLDARTIVLLNASLEIVGGVFLAFGFWTRWVALLLGLHLLGIACEIGLSAIGVRDFALAVSTLALSLFGGDVWTLDGRMKQ